VADSIGGPARRTLRQLTPARIAGGSALRVRTVTAGERNIEGGPALPVYYVQDSELRANGGSYTLQGNQPVPIFEAGAGAIIEGRAAIPVYVTNPANGDGDPIGDGLRADAVAYWRLDEVSGIRVDATGNGHDASDQGIGVGQVIGKIGNAASFNGLSDPLGNWLEVADAPDIRADDSFEFVAWIKLPEVIDYSPIVIYKGFGDSELNIDFYHLKPDIFIAGADLSYPELTGTTVLDANIWYLVHWWWENGVGLGVQVNDGSPETLSFTLGNIAPTSDPIVWANTLIAGLPIGNGGGLIVDEAGFWGRILTTEERSYLWNGGAGLALFT
jgi:hypothetical protein